MARYSPQRELILEILHATKAHPSAALVYEEARKRMPNISLGTVYRNLEKLSQEGIIETFIFKDISHFDGESAPHPHFCCTVCGKVTDLSCDNTRLHKTIDGLDGCEIEGETLLFRGICRECKNEKN